MGQIIKGRSISKGVVEGTALVSKERLSFLYTDPATGRFLDRGHSLYGQDLKDTILVIPWMRANLDMWKLYWCWKEGTAPKAIVAIEADDYIIAGTIMSEMPCVHRLEVDPTKAIKSGQRVRVDGDRGIIEILE